MTDEEVVLFLDKIHTGEDAEFEYNGRIFWAQGYWKNKVNMSHSEVYDATTEEDYMLLLDVDCPGDRIKIFENAALFDGKTFHEVKDDINWIW